MRPIRFFERVVSHLPLQISTELFSTLSAHLSKKRNSAEIRKLLDAAYWKRNAIRWKTYSAPLVPSAGDVALYKKFLDSYAQEGNVLLLGATSALRKMLAAIPLKHVFVWDAVPEVFLDGTTDRESWVKADWRIPIFLPQTFDAIIGDLVLHQFEPKEEKYFFSRIAALLVPGGACITRVHLRKTDHLPLDVIIEKTLSQGVTLSRLELVYTLAQRIRDAHTIDRQVNQKMLIEEFSDYLRTHPDTHPAVSEACAFIHQNETLFPHTAQRMAPTESEFKELVEPHFSEITQQCASDYLDSELFPVFCLKK
jgi:hypothetical protein